MNNYLQIRDVKRTKADGSTESLSFVSGVNILTGPQDSGKTFWLSIIDFLMGDNGNADEAFLEKEDDDGNKLAEIYISAEMTMIAGDEEISVARKWKDFGIKGKVIVDGEPLEPKDFSINVLNKLGFPNIRFTKGNPFGSGITLDLSLRMLFRHVYRQERFWNDLADKQNDTEQHVALTQFLGAAEALFSPISNQIVEQKKSLYSLEAQKLQFNKVVEQIARGLNADLDQASGYTTKETVEQRIKQLKDKGILLINERTNIIARAASGSLERVDISNSPEIRLSKRRAELLESILKISNDREIHSSRTRKFETMLQTCEAEIEKLKRTKTAGNAFADLKITHCPACDQSVEHKHVSSETCFLCNQAINTESQDGDSKRVDFEINQLEVERQELRQTIAKMKEGLNAIESQLKSDQQQLVLVDRDLEPMRQQLAGLVHSQLSSIDAERGRINEQIESLLRLIKTLEGKNNIDYNIDVLKKHINELTREEARLPPVDIEQMSSFLTEEMMNYLTIISINDPRRWGSQQRISLAVSHNGFNFFVGQQKWHSRGGTSQAYFLLAYHYGLLALSLKSGSHYPGLFIVEMMPELAEGVNMDGAENYLVEPFVDLCNRSEGRLQAIFAGRYFNSIEGTQEIKLENFQVVSSEAIPEDRTGSYLDYMAV